MNIHKEESGDSDFVFGRVIPLELQSPAGRSSTATIYIRLNIIKDVFF